MRRSRKLPDAPTTAETALEQLLRQYVLHIRTRNYSEGTIKTQRHHILTFIAWTRERGITEPIEVTRTVIEAYQRHVFHHRKKNGEALAFTGQKQRLIPLRVWFRWMARQHHILHNPASEMELPRVGFRLPRAVLTADEVERILVIADIRDPLGLRDRAILETLYSTGMRRLELANLKLWDIDAERKTVLIRHGKGKKDRMIPIGDRAVLWINKYIREAHPQLVAEPDEGSLFLANTGEPIDPGYLSDLVAGYVLASGVQKKGACHMFRHTMATLMLENGADIRFIQAMLGHSDLQVTDVYTHVAIRKLQEVHRATHPAKLEREKQELLDTIAAEDDDTPEEQSASAPSEHTLAPYTRADGTHRRRRDENPSKV